MKSAFIMLTFVASASFAANDSTSKISYDTSRSSVDNPAGFVPFVGAGVGYMGTNDTLQTGGTPSAIKVLGSYYFEAPIVADVGVGMMNQQFSQKDNVDDSISGENYEAAARYKFENRWQAGAIVNAFGSNSARYGASDSQLTTFGGVQALKEFAVTKELLLRAGARVMTDLNIRDEQVNVGMIDLELGWIPEKAATVQETVAATEREPAVATTPVESQPAMTYTIEGDKFHFAVNEAQIEPKEVTNLQSLSEALAQNSDLFEKVEVVGHADQTGPEAFNEKLSDERAQNVATNLVKSGLAESKVATVAKGESEPLMDSLQPEALRQNRRVEIKFIGVKDQAALEKILSTIR